MHGLRILFQFIFGVFFLVLGLGGLMGAWPAYKEGTAFLKDGLFVQGKVVDDLGGQRSKLISVEFESGTGRTHRTYIHTGTPRYRGGETVALFFDPKNPDKVILDEPSERWSERYGVLFGGITFFSIGAFCFFFGIRNYRRIKVNSLR